MPNLTAKHESFIATMKQGEEFARYGFDLLVKQPAPENFFVALQSAGFFDASNNSGPVPSGEDGYVRIPFWNALSYLEVVAKRSSDLSDATLANRVMDVLRAATSFRDAEGKPLDNYHTHHKFAEIVGVVPLGCVTNADIDMVPIWLDSRFDHGLVGSALGNGLLKRLLVDGSEESVAKACALMRHLMAFRWLSDQKGRGRELVTLVDDYWLKEIVDKYAKEIGSKAGLKAVKIFEDGLRAIFSDSRRSYGSALWRPAVEENSQNMDFRGAENRHVEGMREALAGWLEAAEAPAVEYVAGALRDEAAIIRRVAIHAVTEYFAPLRDSFETVIGEDLFVSEFRHELYRLLKLRFSGMSEAGKAATIAALRELPKPKTGEDRERRLKYTQREWLTAIKDEPEAAGWFAELSADPSLGVTTDHPDFLSYHETWTGPGPSPFGEESLVAFAEDGTIVERLNAFEEEDRWRGPTLGGLVAALESTVASSPNVFFPILSDFHHAKVAFQHALIAGLKRAFEASGSAKSSTDWAECWPKLMPFFSSRLNDEAFWALKAEESDDLTPTKAWLTIAIAGFLESGTKDDKIAYPPDLLPQGWQIIATLLERVEDERNSPTDPMMRALNSERGHVIAAMYNHALRVCRLAKKNGQSIEQAWGTLEPAFNAELAKCRDANFEFSTLSASYLVNIQFMSQQWLEARILDVFPANYSKSFRAAVGGMIYASPTRVIYNLLASKGILAAALETKLDGARSRERIIEWICLAFLWGDERLDTALMLRVFEGGVEDLQSAVEAFSRMHGDKLTDVQTESVLLFWEKCLDWVDKKSSLSSHFMSRLSRLAPYIAAIDDRTKKLLLAVVPYVHSDYSADRMIKELTRLVDTNPAATVDLLEHMFEIGAPNYDVDDKLKNLLQYLYERGCRAGVIRCVEKLRKSLPGMIEFYKKLTSE